eukprot:TRINITY_DN44817_c0_g1_i1.p1 TRINITY_DN44817_c0_g1~~TRINITY_DN44817_c0_g1_i1.p1  ORF type:complete len:338 (-),score=57.83 TRINITY_DN44817_c0_g1_i1:124-1137(-)
MAGASGASTASADASGQYLQKFNDKWVPILHGFVQKSPPCQLGDVLSACQRLCQAPLPPELVGRACSDYNEKSLIAVRLLPPAAEGTCGIVVEVGRQGSRSQRTVPYLDPRDELIFHVDQELQECVSVKHKMASNDLASEFTRIDQEEAKPFRLALEREMDKYVAERYPGRIGDGLACSVVHSFMGEEIGGDIEIRFYISTRRSRPKGQWAGQWISQWRALFNPEQETPAKVVGTIEFSSHYAEEANVQFNRKLSKTGKVSETTDPDIFARQVRELVASFEDEFHRNTEDVCACWNHGPLKSLRRVLPLTKERFDWRPMRHQIVKEMKAARKDDTAG